MEKTSPDSPTTTTEREPAATPGVDVRSASEQGSGGAASIVADAEGVVISSDANSASGPALFSTVAEEASRRVTGSVTLKSPFIEFTFDEVEILGDSAEELVMRVPEPISIPDAKAPLEADPQLLESIEKIPQKMAFKIGEVADMVGVKQYVLRYWETEFEALRPRKSKNNQRVYTRKDVETALLVKKLLYKDRFSIEGARAALRQLKSQVKEEKAWRNVAHHQEQALEELRSIVEDLKSLKAFLE